MKGLTAIKMLPVYVYLDQNKWKRCHIKAPITEAEKQKWTYLLSRANNEEEKPQKILQLMIKLDKLEEQEFIPSNS